MMVKGQSAPRTITGGLRAKAWWVLRKNKSITLTELKLTLCNGSEKNADTNLRYWLNKLVDAGFIARERIFDGKLARNKAYRYVLVKDVGPKAPVVRASKGEVFDPNSGEVIGAVGAGLVPAQGNHKPVLSEAEGGLPLREDE